MTIIEVVQSDKLYKIDFTLKDANDVAFDLTTGSSVAFRAQKENGTSLAVNGSITVGTPTAGQCYYTVQAGDFDTPGRYYAEIEVTYTDGKVITLPNIIVKVNPQLPRTV
jgi:hypothetical protein